MSLFDTAVSIINRYCDYFKDLFSNKQFACFKLFVYAMLKDYKRLNLSSLAKELPLDYQQLQYFFSESKWSQELLNTKRLNLLKRQRTTGFSKKGILVIDDTGSIKLHAKNTEGVSYQYCPVIKNETYCNVAVGSCFVQGTRHIPLELKFYKPEDEFLLGKDDPDFKSKLDFAKELIEDARAKDIPFEFVAFDSWYTSNDFLDYLQESKLKFVSEIRSNRYVLFRHPVTKAKVWMQLDELVKLIKRYLPHKMKGLPYNERLLFCYCFDTYLKDCDVPIQACLVIGKWSDEDSKDAHLLISNEPLSYKKVVFLYMQRWEIEQLFRELKDTFYFDHYQVRHKEKIMRYWQMCILVWSLIYWIKQNGYLYRTINASLSSFGDYKQALLKLILFSSYACLSKNNLLYGQFFADIKSQRFKDYCYA